MATITDTDLTNLKNALQTLNADFSGINWETFEAMGGNSETDVDVNDVDMQTSETKEQDVATEINVISDSLVWLTDVVNALFSISNISLDTESSREVTTIKNPPGGAKE